MLRLRLIEKPNMLNGSITLNNRFMIFYRNPMLITSNIMINIEFHTSSGGRQGLVTFAEGIPCKIPSKVCPLLYGTYTITEAVGDNNF
jgi:hypothetical protein